MAGKIYKNKIKISVIIISLLPILFLGIFFSKNIYETRLNDYFLENERYLNEKVNVLYEEIISKCESVDMISKGLSYYFFEGNYDINNIVNNFKNRYPYFKSINVFHIQQKQPLEFGNDDYFFEKIIDGKFRYILDNDFLYIAKGININNNINRYVVCSIEYSEFFKWFKRYTVDINMLIDFGGNVLLKDYKIDDFNQKNLKNFDDFESQIFDKEGKEYFLLSKNYNDVDIKLQFYREARIIEILNSIYFKYIIEIGLLIIISLMFTYIISDNLNYPFSRIKKVAKKIVSGEYEARIEDNHDFLNLNDNFNLMAEKNQDINQEFVNYAIEMLEKNDKLSELNLQLESSYNQLKAITEMLEFSKNKYSALFENINDFIWICDNFGKITYVNQIMCEKIQYTEKELVGSNISKIFLDLPDMTKKEYSNVNIWAKSKKGEEIVFSANSKRLFKDGKLIGYQGTARTVDFEEVMESRILRKNIEFEIIKKITFSLAKGKNLNELLTIVAKKVDELFSPELCTIRTLEGKYLKLFFKTGSNKEYKGNLIFHINEDISGQAVINNKFLRISDFQAAKFANREITRELLPKLSEIIILPISRKDKVYGTINICTKNILTDADLKILKTLANQASIAIDKVKLYDNLKEDYLNTIRALASAVEAKDKYTEGHSLRVSKIAYLIGKEMNFTDEELEEIEIAGTLHDIGKIGIDDEVLLKKGSLTCQEYEYMKKHTNIGEKILRPIGLSKNIIDGVFLHHKRYDLKGYPMNLELEELGLFPSIIGVADALDAMTSNRTYAKEKNLEEAIREIEKNSGEQFNPYIVKILTKLFNTKKDEIKEIIDL